MKFKDVKINQLFVFVNQNFESDVCRKIMLGFEIRFDNSSQYGYIVNGFVFPCPMDAEVIPLYGLNSATHGILEQNH